MERKALGYALATVLIWGSSFAAIRASFEGGFTPGTLLVVRFLIASALFALYACWPGTSFRLPARSDIWRIAGLGFIGITVYHFGVTYGETTVSAGTAGMIIASAPIFTMILAVVLLNERLSRTGWVGLVIGFTGIALIMFGAEGASFTVSKEVMYLLIAAIATSLFFVYQKPYLKTYRPLELTAYVTWFGSIPFLVALPDVVPVVRDATAEALGAAIYLGIFPTAIAYVLWAVALQEGEAGLISSLLYFEPVVAIVVAWLWLGEWPPTLSLIGGGVAIVSVGLIQWAHARDRRKLVESSR